jgi:hypothetical protein
MQWAASAAVDGWLCPGAAGGVTTGNGQVAESVLGHDGNVAGAAATEHPGMGR